MAGWVSAHSRSERADGDELWRILIRVARAAHSHRTTGHAAEMAFFAALTLVPSTIAVGAALGASKQVLGHDIVAKAENAVVGAVRTLMGPELADSVIAPFVHAQLSQSNGGVAVGGLLIAWWLSSHLFEATGHALDSAYGVADARATAIGRLLALAFALVSVVLVAVTVEMMVVGPLGSPSSGPAHWLGLGHAYAVAWSIMRWPMLLLVVVVFLMCLYRFAPNVRHTCRECLPGAVLGAALWILAAAAFRLAAALGLRAPSGVANDDPAVTIIGQSVHAVVATVLWAYLASIAILLGGELNALLKARRRRRPA
jgi:membrane protein